MAGPFFIPDVSAHQGDRIDFGAIAADPRMVGCIIKATEGVHYAPRWFTEMWPRVRAAGGSRYGASFFRGCYHYARPTPSGAAQADYLITAVDRAGGFGPGDLPPAWDIEGERWSSAQQVVDVSSQFAERIKQQIGRTPILYTGVTWRKFAVRTRAGFEKLWTTHMDKMVPYGWPNADIVLWQYAGTVKGKNYSDYYNPRSAAAIARYPTNVTGFPPSADMNVVMDGGAPAASIDRVRKVLLDAAAHVPTPPGSTSYDVSTLEQDLRQAVESARHKEAKRGGRGVSLPIVIGVGAAGLLALGIMLAVGRDELV